MYQPDEFESSIEPEQLVFEVCSENGYAVNVAMEAIRSSLERQYGDSILPIPVVAPEQAALQMAVGADVIDISSRMPETSEPQATNIVPEDEEQGSIPSLEALAKSLATPIADVEGIATDVEGIAA